MVVWYFFAVPWACLRFVIVVFPDHTHALTILHNNILKVTKQKKQKMIYWNLSELRASYILVHNNITYVNMNNDSSVRLQN